MVAFVIVAGVIASVDQAVKWFFRRWLGAQSVSLGFAGQLRLVPSKMWFARVSPAAVRKFHWLLWSASAAVLAFVAAWVPPARGWSGLLVGGAFSHAIETSVRGGVCDYVCLRFWPAFNLADLAVSLGAAGTIWAVMRAAMGG